MNPHQFTYPFENYCTVKILGTEHGFHDLTTEQVQCFHADNPAKPLVPAHVHIDPVTQDVTVTFFIAEHGTVLIRHPHAEP